MRERRALAEQAQQDRERQYNKQVAENQQRYQRWKAKTAANPMKQDQLLNFEKAESQRANVLPQMKCSRSEQKFSDSIMAVFRERLQQEDELETLRAEKYSLLQQEREHRARMAKEWTEMKALRASQLRASLRPGREELRRKLEMREEERYQKQEFMRALTGWNGVKSQRRSKSVTELWKEHQESRLQAASCSTLSGPAGSLDSVSAKASDASYPPSPSAGRCTDRLPKKEIWLAGSLGC